MSSEEIDFRSATSNLSHRERSETIPGSGAVAPGKGGMRGEADFARYSAISRPMARGSGMADRRLEK